MHVTRKGEEFLTTFYTNFEADHPQYKNAHINCLELLTVLHAVRLWAPLWSGRHLRIFSDNMATVISVNKGTSQSVTFMSILRELFWLSVLYDFRVSAVHVPGTDNVLADVISRLHVPTMARRFLNMFNLGVDRLNVFHNMSFESFLCLQGNLPP